MPRHDPMDMAMRGPAPFNPAGRFPAPRHQGPAGRGRGVPPGFRPGAPGGMQSPFGAPGMPPRQ